MDEKFESVLTQVAERGWSVTPDFLLTEILDGLIEEEHALWEEGAFRQAGIGTGVAKVVRPEIRSDRILWLEPGNLTPQVTAYWQVIDALRVRLNREFFLGLNDFEAHFAVYPPGSFYKRHLDRHQQVRKRTISCILYLNRDWTADAGGYLRIYEGTDGFETHVDVLPEFGTFVCFRSDTVFHEVLPATRERFSLTGWLRAGD